MVMQHWNHFRTHPCKLQHNTNGEQANQETTNLTAQSKVASYKLPYGWECALDDQGRPYYINHINHSTTHQHPGSVGTSSDASSDQSSSLGSPPQPRTVTIEGHPELGFGFVASSSRPVLVRFVKEGGPSEGVVHAGDQILAINGIDVAQSPRDQVIDLIKGSKNTVTLTVCQPNLHSSQKSAFLTQAKKDRLRQNPSHRVRFADGVIVNGSPLFCSSVVATPTSSSEPVSADPQATATTCPPKTMNHPASLMDATIPNVLKVFLENAQTKTFKYDSTTTVQSVINILCEKLAFKSSRPFGLVCEHIRYNHRNRLLLLDPNEKIANVASRPNAHNLRCLFRMVFIVPNICQDLPFTDPNVFDYLYVQCCNDLVVERFEPNIKYELALRLAALRLLEHSLTVGNVPSSTSAFSSGSVASLCPLSTTKVPTDNNNVHSYSIANKQSETSPSSSSPSSPSLKSVLSKINLKSIHQEYGLEHFVPHSLFSSMKIKELIRLLIHSIKLNATTMNWSCDNGKDSGISVAQVKLKFVQILAELPCLGSKKFYPQNRDLTQAQDLVDGMSKLTVETQNVDNKSADVNDGTSSAPTVPNQPQSPPSANETPLYVTAKYGLCKIYSQISSITSTPNTLVPLEQIGAIKLTKSDDSNSFQVDVYKKSDCAGGAPMKSGCLQLVLSCEDAEEFVLWVKGYYKLLTNREPPC